MADLIDSCSPNQRELLLIVYRIFAQRCKWPDWEAIDYCADEQQLGDAWDLLRKLPAGLICGVSLHAEPSAEQSVGLTMTGMAYVANHDDVASIDFRVFCESIMLAGEIADSTAPPAVPTLSASDCVQRVNMPAAGRSALLSRLHEQWSVNGQLWTALSATDDSWVATLDRKGLRAYRSAGSKGDFVQAETRRVQKITGQLATARQWSAARVLPASAGLGAVLPSWFSLLPSEFASTIESRITSGHVEDAFLKGWKTLAKDIRDTTGLALDGSALINQASRRIRHEVSESEENLALGYVDFLRGLARMRNVHAHPEAIKLSELEAAAFTLLLGACAEWVRSCEELTQPHQRPEREAPR